MSRDPFSDYVNWQRRERRRQIVSAVAGWVLVILAAVGMAFVAWLIVTALLVLFA